MSDNVHSLKPYPFHSWYKIRRELFAQISVCKTVAEAMRVMDKFFDSFTEVGASYTIDREAIRRLPAEEIASMREYYRRACFRQMGEEIAKAGLYSEDCSPEWHGNTTNLRALVFMGPKWRTP